MRRVSEEEMKHKQQRDQDVLDKPNPGLTEYEATEFILLFLEQKSDF